MTPMDACCTHQLWLNTFFCPDCLWLIVRSIGVRRVVLVGQFNLIQHFDTSSRDCSNVALVLVLAWLFVFAHLFDAIQEYKIVMHEGEDESRTKGRNKVSGKVSCQERDAKVEGIGQNRVSVWTTRRAF